MTRIIHIGYQKCLSTYLQRNFFAKQKKYHYFHKKFSTHELKNYKNFIASNENFLGNFYSFDNKNYIKYFNYTDKYILILRHPKYIILSTYVMFVLGGKTHLNFNKIVAIESRGFIFAAPLAYNLSKSLILIRKKNKLPADTFSEDFELEYGKATIEIHKDSIKKSEKVIIVDDLIATGGTALAAAKLVEKSGGIVESFVFVINLFDLRGKDILEKKSYKTIRLLDFPGH